MSYQRLFLFLCIFNIALGCKKSFDKEVTLIDNPKEDVLKDLIIISENKIDSANLDINFKPKGDYHEIKNKLITDRSYFKKLYFVNASKAIDSASQYLYSKLLNDIVPHWYGTHWDFNGHTNVPNEGEVACGYFVSTTLKHIGFNLNRYKMAQQAGLIEAKTLQPKSEIKIWSGLSFETLKQHINKVYTNGIYFVGLDNHVGYMILRDQELYFLHSSYCDDKVVIEYAETSPCFSSNIYVFAEITTNKNLIKKWVFNDPLIIPDN